MILSETVALLDNKDGVLILDGDSWEVTEGGHTGIPLYSIVSPPEYTKVRHLHPKQPPC